MCIVGSSEENIVGNLTFHQLGLIIAAATTLFAIIVSFYLIFMHATHYTKPYEQRQYVVVFLAEEFTLTDTVSFASCS